MKIKKIILDNIRSYEHQEITFPDGSLLLSGDIGSGKTSILLGIEFALFGLQPGQKGSSILRNGQVHGGVILEFEIDDKTIVLERTLKKAKTISQDYCSISIDDVKEEISVTELKSKVLELLNYPREFSKKQNLLYKFTVYTPQEEMKQIILEDSETRINTLRHVFGIDKYKRILENASVLISKVREEKRIKEAITSNLEQDKLNITSKEEELAEKSLNILSIEKDSLEQGRKSIEAIAKRQNEDIDEEEFENIHLIPLKFLIKNGFLIRKNDEYFPLVRLDLTTIEKVTEKEQSLFERLFSKRELTTRSPITKNCHRDV